MFSLLLDSLLLLASLVLAVACVPVVAGFPAVSGVLAVARIADSDVLFLGWSNYTVLYNGTH